MRHLPKALVVAVCLLAITLLTSSAYAKDVMSGKFTLSQATQWKGATLPAGEYTFTMTHTQTDANMLFVRGAKQSLNMWIFPQSACDSCKEGALTIAMQGDGRAVTSLELPGYRVNFKARNAAGSGKESVKASAPTEQVAVHVGSN